MLKKLFNHIFIAYEELKYIWYEWDTFTPRRKWEIFRKIGDLSLRTIGIKIFSSIKLSRFWFALLISILSYYLLAIYTTIYYAKHGQFTDGLPCWSVAGITTSVSFKFLIILL